METKYLEDLPHYINELLWRKHYPINETVFHILFENLWKKIGGYECIKTSEGYHISRTFLKTGKIIKIGKNFPSDTPIHGWENGQTHPKGSIHRFYDSVCKVLYDFEDSTRQIDARQIFEEEFYELVKLFPLSILEDYDGFKTVRGRKELKIEEEVSRKRLENDFGSLEEVFKEENSILLIEKYTRDNFFDNLTLELLRRKGYPIRFQYFHDVLEKILKKKGVKFDYEILRSKFRYFLSKNDIKLTLDEDKMLNLDLGYPSRSIGYIKVLTKMILKNFKINNPRNLDKIIEEYVIEGLIDREEEILDELRV